MRRHPLTIERRVDRAELEQVDAQPADRRVSLVAARQFGVVDVRELRRCGLSDDAICTRKANGWLHAMHRGVFAVGHPNPPLEGVFLAAVKACPPRAVLSHFAAASLWELVEWDGRLPEVTLHGGSTSAVPRVRVHRTSHLDHRDVRWHKGIPVTSPARTLLDLASQLPARELRQAVRRAQSLRLVTIEEIVATLTRLRRRRGARKLARIVASGPAPTRSVLEDVVLDLILRGGFEHPDVNKPMYFAGRKVIPDFRWPRDQIVVEADSRAWHDNKLAREDDAERQEVLEAHGERVVRVTWEQAVARPTDTLARLRAAGVPVAH